MPEEQVRRRRRRGRRGRGGRGGGRGGAAPEAPATEVTEAEASPGPPDWRWRSFPVFFGFVCGALAMAFLIGAVPGLAPIFFFVALFGVSFGLAHILGRTVFARRR